jgi:hypothetical protein
MSKSNELTIIFLYVTFAVTVTNEGHTNFTKLVNETLSLIEQAQKATGLEQEIAIWQQIFGSEFPRQLS